MLLLFLIRKSYSKLKDESTTGKVFSTKYFQVIAVLIDMIHKIAVAEREV